MSAIQPGGSGFSKLLVSTEKTERDRAIRLIAAWLVKRGDVSDQELAKLWKGIFYCFWLSDKPKVQQQLAERLAKMSVVLPPRTALKFLRHFWLTMMREWHGIDRLRMDKFYLLCRKFLRHNLQMLADQDWPQDLSETFASIMETTLLDVGNRKVPDGLRYHFSETFLMELDGCYAGREETENEAPMVPLSILKPFVVAMATSTNKQLRTVIESEVLSKLLPEKGDWAPRLDREGLASLIRDTAKATGADGSGRLKDQISWANKVLGPDPAATVALTKESKEGKEGKEDKKGRKKEKKIKKAEFEEAVELPADEEASDDDTSRKGKLVAAAVEPSNVEAVETEEEEHRARSPRAKNTEAKSSPKRRRSASQSPERPPQKEKVPPATDKPKKRRLSDAQDGAAETKREKRRVSWGPNATKTFRSQVPLARFGTAADPIRDAKTKSPKKPVLKR